MTAAPAVRLTQEQALPTAAPYLRVGEALLARGLLEEHHRDAALREQRRRYQPLGQLLCAHAGVAPETLARHIEAQCLRRTALSVLPRFGWSATQAGAAHRAQQGGERLALVLQGGPPMSAERQAAALALWSGLPYADPLLAVHAETLAVLDAGLDHSLVEQERGYLPLGPAAEGGICIALREPEQQAEASEVFGGQGPLHFYIASAQTLDALYVRSYLPLLHPALLDLGAAAARYAAQLAAPSGKGASAALERLLSVLLVRACVFGAHGLRLREQTHGYRVEARVDGVLRELGVLGAPLAAALVRRLQAAAASAAHEPVPPRCLGDEALSPALSPAPSPTPSTTPSTAAHFSLPPALLRYLERHEPHLLTLPTSTLAAPSGSNLAAPVLHIGLQDRLAPRLPLEALGLEGADLRRLQACLQQPSGLLLVTGPAASGRTSTLHALLDALPCTGSELSLNELPDASLDTPREAFPQVRPAASRHIAAEPPLPRLRGIREVHAAGPVPGFPLTGSVQRDITGGPPRSHAPGPAGSEAFEQALASDPDVLYIDPLNTPVLAGHALQAAASGRMILATLEGARAHEAPAHLAELGLPLAGLYRQLRMVLAQRLVPTLCQQCALPDTSRSVRSILAGPGNSFLAGEGAQPRRAAPQGCPQCHGTGYRGRALLYEMLVLDTASRALLESGVGPLALEQALLSDGRSLWDQGVRLVYRGQTSLAALRSVLAEPA